MCEEVPMGQFNKVVLAIHAHPDDTEAFCAGTLKLLKDHGYRIIIATMTAGGMGGIHSNENETMEIRKKEAEKASRIIDADYMCLDQRDGYVFDGEEIRVKTTELIRRVNAGIVLTHLPFDYHTDHRATANIVENATMMASLPNVPTKVSPLQITPLLYHTETFEFTDPLGEQIVKPHFFMDISNVIDTKMEMLSCHQSQAELVKVMFKIDGFFEEIRRYSNELGRKVKVPYAEAFWQHLGGGFQKTGQIQQDLAEYIRHI